MKKSKKFILILSYDFDHSTSDVMDWLNAKGENVVRLNGYIPLNTLSVKLNKLQTSIQLSYNNTILCTDSIKSFWYRKGMPFSQEIENLNKNPTMNHFLNYEKKAVQDFLIYLLDKKASVNQIKFGDINKLEQLVVAMKCKLNVPNTLLTKSLLELKDFNKQNFEIITKTIQAPFMFKKGKYSRSMFTSVFNAKDVQETSSQFFITKFQEQIYKQFELRIFYLQEQFYSMAIFSQNNPKTSIDFRNYDAKLPNRNVPFNLPYKIKKKLLILMKLLNLQSGSIDMIVDKQGKYHFLEVNPVGQFGMVSKPCNYQIEEKIANILSTSTYAKTKRP